MPELRRMLQRNRRDRVAVSVLSPKIGLPHRKLPSGAKVGDLSTMVCLASTMLCGLSTVTIVLLSTALAAAATPVNPSLDNQTIEVSQTSEVNQTSEDSGQPPAALPPSEAQPSGENRPAGAPSLIPQTAAPTSPEHGQIEITLPKVVIPKVLPVAASRINLEDFRAGKCDNNQRGKSDRQISLSGTTIPSLWWTRDLLVAKPQFNPKLIDSWLICGAGEQSAAARVCAIVPGQNQRVVKMLVNTQLWTVLDYLGRYEFLYRFGSATSECGYNIYIYNTDAVLVADYICDFQSTRRNRDCRLRPDPSGRSGLKRGTIDVFSATDYRIELP